MSPRHRRRLLWALVPALLVTTLLVILVWLSLPPSVPKPDPATAEALEAVTEKWWRPGAPSREIPEGEWPPEVRRLGPKAVRATPEGVYIKLGSRYVEEWGLFVLPERSDYRPQQGADPSFQLLRGRVYKYHVSG